MGERQGVVAGGGERRHLQPVQRVGLFLVALLISLAGVYAAEEDATRNVLVLYSHSRMQPAIVEGDRGLREAVRTSVDRPVLVFDDSLDAPRFSGAAYEAMVVRYLGEKYARRRPDVIVAVGGPSTAFLLLHRAELFPRVPIVHTGLDAAFLRSIPDLPADVVGIPVDFDFIPTIELALRWHPRARRLVIVTGASEIDRQYEAQLRAVTRRVEGRATVEFLSGLPMNELLPRLAGLGGDAVVFSVGFYRDGGGRCFYPRDSVRAIAAASSAPVYGSFSTFIGTGIVGGYMPSFEEMGRLAGETVNELLAGVPPDTLGSPRVVPQVLTLDWRQLRRWGIGAGAVPDGAVVVFREPTLLEAYAKEVFAVAVVLALQASLIGVLLVERRRRRRAEATAATQRLELAHASRLAVAGELTGAIAHEVYQPLGAILSNADAAELILESSGDRHDELKSILADIRRDDRRASEVIRRLRSLLARHVVERRPFDVNDVLRDVESMLASEARRRRVALQARPAPAPATVLGDPVQMQQILLNLVLNAMDAVADQPEERRTVAVPVESVNGRVTVTVRDRGHGIAPEHLEKLFDSFFTTKREGMGLGLSIARTLVESQGGRIWAESEPGVGAAFHVELPAADATGSAPPRAA
jgi:signal transduction histidine kinase